MGFRERKSIVLLTGEQSRKGSRLRIFVQQIVMVVSHFVQGIKDIRRVHRRGNWQRFREKSGSLCLWRTDTDGFRHYIANDVN